VNLPQSVKADLWSYPYSADNLDEMRTSSVEMKTRSCNGMPKARGGSRYSSMWWYSAWKIVDQIARKPLDATAAERRAVARSCESCVRCWQWKLWAVMNSAQWRSLLPLLVYSLLSKKCISGGGRFAVCNYKNELEEPRGRTADLWSGIRSLNVQGLRGFGEVHTGKSWDVTSFRLHRCLSSTLELILFSAM